MLSAMPKIVDVTAAALSIPLARPTRIATRTVNAREFVVVRVEGDDGITGIGYTYPVWGGGGPDKGFRETYSAEPMK